MMFIKKNHTMEKDSIDINEGSKVKLDIKSLVGIIAGIVSLAGIWFTLCCKKVQNNHRYHVQVVFDFSSAPCLLDRVKATFVARSFLFTKRPLFAPGTNENLI